MFASFQQQAKSTAINDSMAMPSISPPKQPQSVSLNFFWSWRFHCFCDSGFSRVIKTCTIPFQLRETKPEAHSAPRRRVYPVWRQFLLLCKKPDCVSSLSPLTAQNKSSLHGSHIYSSSNCPLRGRSPLWNSSKLMNSVFAFKCFMSLRPGISVCHFSLRSFPFPCSYKILYQPLHQQYHI